MRVLLLSVTAALAAGARYNDPLRPDLANAVRWPHLKHVPPEEVAEPVALPSAETRHIRGQDQDGHDQARPEVEVAVVGNGPLSEEDRKLINASTEIYRFNSMTNMKRGERVGTVFLRRAGDYGDRIWGLQNSESFCPRLSEAEGLVIVWKGQGSAVSEKLFEGLRKEWPSVISSAKESSCTDVNIFGTKYNSGPHPEWAMAPVFSSGFVGIGHVLATSAAIKRGAKLHIFGMNWKSDSVHSGGHPFEVEEKALRGAAANGSLVIHATPTDTYKPRDKDGNKREQCEYDEKDVPRPPDQMT